MYIQFRQGIIQYSLPDLVRINGVACDLVVEDAPIVLTFSAGAKNYLWIEKQSIAHAWSPVVIGQTQWLYWDINMRTGVRTFGFTKLQPITSPAAPVSPQRDQHWYNSTTNEMKTWTGTAWKQVLRVFACKVANGSVISSVGADTPLFSGTQVGDTSTVAAGYIVYDTQTNRPIVASDGTFVTTEDQLKVMSTADANIKLASTEILGEAQQNLAAYTIVKFIDFGKITHADQFAGQQYKRFGIIQHSAIIGEVVQVLTEGLIINEAWDWTSAGVNAELYCDASGVISATPSVAAQYPIATVVDRHTIQLGSPHISVTSAPPVLGSATNVGVVRLTVPPANPVDPVAVGANDPVLTQARPPLPHTHAITDVTGLSLALAGLVQRSGDSMTGPLSLNANPTQPLHAATKAYVDSVAVAGIVAGGGLTLSGNTLDINTASSSRIVINADSIDLATTGVTPGTYDSVTVDAYGRVISASTIGPQTITLTGDVSGTGTTNIVVALANTGVVAGTYKSVTVDSKGRITSGTNPTTLAGFGITDGVVTVNGHSGPNITLTTSDITSSLGYTPVNQVGDTLTGPLILSADPSQPLEAATKQYVDSQLSSGNYVPLDGSIPMTGVLTTLGVVLSQYTKVTSARIQTSSTDPIVVAAFDVTQYKVAKFTISIVDATTNIHALEIMVVTDGVIVNTNEYGIVVTNDLLGSFDAYISGTTCSLQFTPAQATPMTVTLTTINQ